MSATDLDRTIAAMGMPWHPAPHEIAKAARKAIAAIEDNGLDAIDMVTVLAARGYSSQTLGDGGSRGTDSTSSTERNGTRTLMPAGAKPPADTVWYGADHEYHQKLHDFYETALWLEAHTDLILSHASDEDRTPSGTGECVACGRFVRPDNPRSGNRIVSGLCPTDYRAYARAGRPVPRSDWIHQRRKSFTDDAGVMHTPEPDHDIDLSVELQRDVNAS